MSAPSDPGPPRATGAKDRAAEAALTAALAQARQRRAEASIAYEEATRGLKFTKEFLDHNTALMNDRLATHGERFLAWLRRYSWGEYSLFAIAADGEPKTQTDARLELAIDKREISHVVIYYERRGLLYREGKKLYPVISPVLSPTPKKVGCSPDFSEFLESWKVAHSTDFSDLEVARSTVKRIRKVILSDYKKSLAERTNSSDTLLEIAGEGPKTKEAGSEALSPFEKDQARLAQRPNAAQNRSNQGEVQSKAQEYLFQQIARMQKAYPKSSFSQIPIDPENPEHQNLVNLILKKLGDYDEEFLVGYAVWVEANFKGWGVNVRQGGGIDPRKRAPGTKDGPASLGLLVNWAEDYARIAGAQRQHERGSGIA